MRKDPQVTFTLSGCITAAAQGCAQPALDSRDNAFGLRALAIPAAMEPSGHLPAIHALGQAPASAGVLAQASTTIELDHAGADAKSLPGDAMVGFGVVAGVGQHAIDLQVPR